MNHYSRIHLLCSSGLLRRLLGNMQWMLKYSNIKLQSMRTLPGDSSRYQNTCSKDSSPGKTCIRI